MAESKWWQWIAITGHTLKIELGAHKKIARNRLSHAGTTEMQEDQLRHGTNHCRRLQAPRQGTPKPLFRKGVREACPVKPVVRVKAGTRCGDWRRQCCTTRAAKAPLTDYPTIQHLQLNYPNIEHDHLPLRPLLTAPNLVSFNCCLQCEVVCAEDHGMQNAHMWPTSAISKSAKHCALRVDHPQPASTASLPDRTPAPAASICSTNVG